MKIPMTILVKVAVVGFGVGLTVCGKVFGCALVAVVPGALFFFFCFCLLLLSPGCVFFCRGGGRGSLAHWLPRFVHRQQTTGTS